MVGILVVFYNDLKHIERIAKAISDQNYRDYKVYSIDNNPALGHADLFRSFLPTVIILPSQGNIGFAKGNNVLAGRAIDDGCEFLWVLNPDMEPEKDALKYLVEFLNNNSNYAISSPLVLHGNSKENPAIQLFGSMANYMTQEKKELFSGCLLNEVTLPESMDTDLVNAGSPLIRARFVTDNYLFEENYFMYNDEIDLMKRICDSGYRISVNSKSVVWHHHDWSVNNKTGYYTMYYYMMRNKQLYFIKFIGRMRSFLELIKQLFLFPVVARFCVRTSGSKLIYYYYLGLIHGFQNKKGKSHLQFN